MTLALYMLHFCSEEAWVQGGLLRNVYYEITQRGKEDSSFSFDGAEIISKILCSVFNLVNNNTNPARRTWMT